MSTLIRNLLRLVTVILDTCWKYCFSLGIIRHALHKTEKLVSKIIHEFIIPETTAYTDPHLELDKSGAQMESGFQMLAVLQSIVETRRCTNQNHESMSYALDISLRRN